MECSVGRFGGSHGVRRRLVPDRLGGFTPNLNNHLIRQIRFPALILVFDGFSAAIQSCVTLCNIVSYGVCRWLGLRQNWDLAAFFSAIRLPH